MYTKIVQDVYNRCIQNVYEMRTTFQETFGYIFYTKLKGSKILYTKLQKFAKIYNIFCIQIFYIHFVYINSDLQKVYIKNYAYICIKNSYRI